ncbi:protein lin-54 homolog [Calliphora vicina]|uniref:protein lin-54 homolog n=1 Tax=Calliphora vicina TaxID=7373 RepID=UPI00325B2657
MDISDNMDSLDDSTALPELSFDDLLDPSPIKKSNKSSFDDDALELDNERKNRTDDTLNTPGPKKPPSMQQNLNTTIVISSGSKIYTPVRTQAVKLGNSSSTLSNVNKNNGGSATTPVLLNTKNVLPKTSAQISNSSIKLTQKIVGGGGGSTGTANLSMSGKTAVRTSNGQIIYIQKTPAPSNVKATAGATTVMKSQTLGGNNSKPVTIQVLRTADGNYVPIKTTTAGTNAKNTTLTLSPTSLAGKKIISSAGGQVIIKGTIKPTDSTGTASAAKTMTTNSITGVRTMVKPMTTSSSSISGQINDSNKSKPIVVHGTSGKQIIVSNQNIVKLSPKTQTITTTAGGGSLNTSTSGSGQIHAIQIPGKIGVQYVRVLPNTKVPAKTLNTTATSSVTSTVSAATKTLNTPNQPVKILNSLPQKFTVVKGGNTKLVVTQKKEATDGNNTDFSPMTSKVQKTIVTVPTIKSLNEDKNKNPQTQQQQQQQSLIKTTLPNMLAINSSTNQWLIRKHKISEINTEIQRITTTTADNAGPPEIKKPTPNNRVVIANNSQPKILNNSIQQPGRITSSVSIPTKPHTTSTTSKIGGGNMVQVTQVTQNGNKLYTVLKPSSVDQKTNPKLYRVLKTNNQTSSATTSANGDTTNKPLINKQQLIQHQQQKQQQFKKQQQQTANTKSLNTATTSSSSSSYLLPIQIKEEPEDSNSTATSNAEATAALLNLPTSMGEEEPEALDPMVGGVRRKHCNCSKSQCLKLYCDCFANGEFCQDCTCKDCFNNLDNEDERQRAIKACLERNPNAFKPKITSSRDQADMRLHNKGCNCKRSGCLKNYCECYEAKIPCSSNCKCVGCRNVEDRPDLDMDPIDPQIMATIAMGGTTDSLTLKRSYEKSQRDFSGSLPGVTIKTEKLSKDSVKPFSSYDATAGAVSPTPERQQCNFITQEVIDATIQCMITQADECEKNNLPVYQTEKMVMEELGRCLVEIIDFSIRNTDNSYSQD